MTVPDADVKDRTGRGSLLASTGRRGCLGGPAHRGGDAVRGGLARDELGTPRLAPLERLVEAAFVGTDGEEPDDDYPERDADQDADHERFHLCSSFVRLSRSAQTAESRPLSEQPLCHAVRWHYPVVAGAAVQASGVRKRFGAIEALAGLDVEVRTGEIYGLLGPNGSGKTTLIRCLAGLLRPDGGQLATLGRVPRDAVAAGRVGYMTQAPALYGDLSVEENLGFFARLQQMERREERIEAVLRTVDLLDRRRSPVSTLSGGMRTRLSLAATLLHEPDLLLLDEPTVGVDPVLRQEFWAHFRGLAGQGVTILVSSHVMDEAGRCDRLGLIHHGRVLAEGSASDLVARAGTRDLESAFLALAAVPA